MQHELTFLNLNGVPSNTPPKNGEVYFLHDPQGSWRPSKGCLLYEIDALCVEIHDALAKKIFGDLETFHRHLECMPPFVFDAGLNSESKISKIEFQKILESIGNARWINQSLYLFDCRKLVSGIQECNKEVVFLQGEFYRILNFESLSISPNIEPDGIRYTASPVTTNIHAMLSFVFIRMYSLLDYITKLIYEIERIKTDFESYPKLACRNELFSSRKKISLNNVKNTLFEKCDLITEIDLYRNLIIHDGLLDDLPKAYQERKGGEIIEKFILLPDRCSEGRLDTFKNRKLFYSRNDKINLRFVTLVSAFQTRLFTTLEHAKAILTEAT